MDIYEIIKTVGVPVAMLIFFIIKDQRRDKADAKEKHNLTEEIKEVRDYQTNTLQGLVVETKETIIKNIDASEKQASATLEFHKTLLRRPCLKEEEIHH